MMLRRIYDRRVIESVDSGCGSVGRVVTSNTRGRGSNPVIGKLYITYLLSTVMKRKEKEAGVGPLKKF